MNIKLN